MLTPMHAGKNILSAKDHLHPDNNFKCVYQKITSLGKRSIATFIFIQSLERKIFSNFFYRIQPLYIIGARSVNTLHSPPFPKPSCWSHTGYVVVLLQYQLIVDMIFSSHSNDYANTKWDLNNPIFY